MIVGNGDIASAIIDREGFLFFASGVSNSREDRESEYQREKDLLLMQDDSRRLVYISSLCVFYENTRYSRHKREMEELVKDNFKDWTIIRIGSITWGVNPNTIINFFRGRRKEGQPLEIRDTERYILRKDEFQHWIDKIPDWNCEMNITGERMTIKRIVEEFV